MSGSYHQDQLSATPPKMIVIIMTLVDLLVTVVSVLLLLRLREWRSQYEGPRRLPVADQDLEEGAAAGWSEEEMAADSPSVASYEASNNTFNSSPPPAVPDPMAAAVQRDGVLTSTPQSQRGSDQDLGYDSRQSSPSSSPRHSRQCAGAELQRLLNIIDIQERQITNHEEMIEFQDREIKKLEIEALSEAFRGLQIK